MTREIKLVDIVPIKQFEQIRRFLHLTDNNNEIDYGQPGYDKLSFTINLSVTCKAVPLVVI